MNKLKLIEKTKLTHDVYELVFLSDKNIECKAGQFITLLLFSWLVRAYSVAYIDWNKLFFIVKRLEKWRWWSKELCDMDIWKELEYMWPSWIFVLQENSKNKLFIGTGTGFAPLYFQIKKCIENNFHCQVHFNFGVRYLEDVFYRDILDKLSSSFPNFSYKIFLSREDFDNQNLEDIFIKWYVTDFINSYNIQKYDEFYICWNPQMVEDVKNKLKSLNKQNIFYEKY